MGIQKLIDKWFCEPDCWQITEKIDELVTELRVRYLQMTADSNNLFQDRPIGRFSWIGHQIQYNQRQRELRDWVGQARAKKCPYNLDAHNWMDRDPPDRPAR